jgi:peptide chain release factor 1
MILEKVAAIDRRYEELNQLMGDQTVVSDRGRLTDLAREQSEIEPIVMEYRAWLAARNELDGAQMLMSEVGGD